MANHCIDVVCAGCGAWYCLVGCSNSDGPGTVSLEQRDELKRDQTMRYPSTPCKYCREKDLYPASNLLPLPDGKRTSK